LAAYLSGSVTGGIGFAGSGANGRGRDSVIANAKKAGKATAITRMIEA
jgi:hypothetical protein